jgi:hypothetical protein
MRSRWGQRGAGFSHKKRRFAQNLLKIAVRSRRAKWLEVEDENELY